MKQLSRQQIIAQEMPEIEAEHRGLFALCWQFYKELRTGAASQGQLLDVFNEIVDQASVHFAHEDVVLKKIVYPRHAMHQLAHRQILIDLVSSQHAMKKVNEMAHRDAQHSLDALLIHHVREDAKFARLVGEIEPCSIGIRLWRG